MTRLYFGFHPCHFEEWRKITAEDESDMPEDGAWLWWIDRKGQIEKARLKIDAEDHFYPSPKYLDEWNVIGWLGMSVVETHDSSVQPDVKTIYDIAFTDGVKAYAAMNEITDEIIKKLEEENK